MDNKTMEKMKAIIENNKNKNGQSINNQDTLLKPNKTKGHTAKRKMSNKTGGLFDR